MPKKRLLLLEDEAHLAFALVFNLGHEGYEVVLAPDIASARRELAVGSFDLLIFDVMLPDGSGFELCQQLRAEGKRTPVLFLTAKGTPDDVVAGLESGADGYLTKPFALKELLARVAAMLRRQDWGAAASAPSDRLRFGDADVDFAEHKVLVRGVPQEMTPLELRLLRYFADREGQIVAREELLTGVWEVSSHTMTRTVDNFLVRLRRIFERDPAHPRHFLTVRGVGYRFVASPP